MDSDAVLENDEAIQSEHRKKIDHKPPWSRAKVDEKDIKALFKSRYRNLKTVNAELRLSGSNSPWRKSMPARFHSMCSEDGNEVNIGYLQNSEEVRNSKPTRDCREGVKPALSDEFFLSFDIVDNMPLSSSKSKRPPLIPSELTPSVKSKPRANNNPQHTSRMKGNPDTKRCNLIKSYSTNACAHLEKEKIKASPKSRFSPFKKLFDPIMKSKSMRNPSCMETDVDDGRQELHQKSLLSDFSRAAEVSTKEENNPVVNSSPIYQRAVLKLGCKHGTPSYKFAVKDPKEEFLIAKPWRTNSEFNSVYTIHSSKHKSWHNQSTPMIGQMQVSSYLCSEVHDNGILEATITSEFNLYDVAQARKSVAEDFKYDPSTCYPLAPEDLHSCLEIAAVVIKIPFHKKGMNKSHVENIRGVQGLNFECVNCASVEVVTTSGTHGLSCCEDGKPSSLLERWRCGGRCDCGGWDMSCPILVLDKKCDADVANCLEVENQWKMILFVQGRKEKIPALCISSDESGQYSINFHAQLSALQAFSICISMLHSSQAASTLTKENKQKLYSDSLKLLVKENMKYKADAVAEEKRKINEPAEKIPLSYILDPPFSPIGRV